MGVLVSGVALNIPRGAPMPNKAVLNLAQKQGEKAAKEMQQSIIADIKRRREEAAKVEAQEVLRQVALIEDRQRLQARQEAFTANAAATKAKRDAETRQRVFTKDAAATKARRDQVSAKRRSAIRIQEIVDRRDERTARQIKQVTSEIARIRTGQAVKLATQEPQVFAARGDALSDRAQTVSTQIAAHTKRGEAFEKIANSPNLTAAADIRSLSRSIKDHNKKGETLNQKSDAVNEAIKQHNAAVGQVNARSGPQATAQPTLSTSAANRLFKEFTSDAKLKNLDIDKGRLFTSTNVDHVLGELRKNPNFEKQLSPESQRLVAETQAGFNRVIKAGGSGIDALAAIPIPIAALVKVAVLPLRGLVKAIPAAVKTVPVTARALTVTAKVIAKGETGAIKVATKTIPRTTPKEAGVLAQEIAKTTTARQAAEILKSVGAARKEIVKKLLDATEDVKAAAKKLIEKPTQKPKDLGEGLKKLAETQAANAQAAVVREGIAARQVAREVLRRALLTKNNAAAKRARELLKQIDDAKSAAKSQALAKEAQALGQTLKPVGRPFAKVLAAQEVAASGQKVGLASASDATAAAAAQAKALAVKAPGVGTAVTPGAVSIGNTGVVVSPIVQNQIKTVVRTATQNLPAVQTAGLTATQIATKTQLAVKTAVQENLLQSTQVKVAVQQALRTEALPATKAKVAQAIKTIVDETVITPKTPRILKPKPIKSQTTKAKPKLKAGPFPRGGGGANVVFQEKFPPGGPFPDRVTYRSGKFWVITSLKSGVTMFRRFRPPRARRGKTLKETFTTLTTTAKPPKQRELDRGVFKLFVSPAGISVVRN